MSNYKDNSGLDTTKPKTSKEEMDRMMKEFLEKGGKIQKLKPQKITLTMKRNAKI
jgi:hypothetical protein